jgi:solute carrier family 35 protein E1
MGAANLYGVLTIMSFIGLLPIALVMESPAKLKAGWDAAIAAGHTAKYLIQTSLVSGFFYYLYNEVAFLCLDNVHPITHAVGNTIKRVVIILASVVVFGTTMTPLNKIGSSLAIFGVLLYSLAKQYCK